MKLDIVALVGGEHAKGAILTKHEEAGIEPQRPSLRETSCQRYRTKIRQPDHQLRRTQSITGQSAPLLSQNEQVVARASTKSARAMPQLLLGKVLRGLGVCTKVDASVT